MTKRYILSFLIYFLSTIIYGQKFGDHYNSISIDSTQGCRLKFLSDSTVELSSIPRHMSPTIKTVHKYLSTDTTIQIFPEPIFRSYNQPTDLYVGHLQVLFPFEAKIYLTKIEGGFIDYNKSLIYVREKDFSNNPSIAYIVDGKTFIQDAVETDGYGLIRKKPKTSRTLQKKLNPINRDNCSIEIVIGLNAYKRFGIKRVYGVIVITTNKTNTQD